MTDRSGNGSGVVWSEDGLIVTNAHVVERTGMPDRILEVELWDGRRVAGRIVKRDRRRDIAAIRVEASGLPAAATGDSNMLRVGELVVAVGNPLGFTGAASTGVVHRLSWSENREGNFEDRLWVVSQLRLAPGNSGGPLANVRGEVMGINTMIAGGLAFSIPSDAVLKFLSGPRKAQASLGVVVRLVPLDRDGSRLGLVVLEVVPGSGADLASLLQGDTLVGAAGKSFRSVHDLRIATQAMQEGVLEVQFRRGASEKIRTVAIRMPPASVKAA
jgi:serine protease Do